MVDRMYFVVGDGRMVLFRRDKLCGTETLNISIPCLYGITACNYAWVANIYSPGEEGDVGIHCS